jgi:hypothetical protein
LRENLDNIAESLALDSAVKTAILDVSMLGFRHHKAYAKECHSWECDFIPRNKYTLSFSCSFPISTEDVLIYDAIAA